MVSKDILKQQLQFTLDSIDAPWLGQKIEGKVRDSFVMGDRRILVTSDRLSAFDQVLTTIPFKGHVLNEMAAYWFEKTKHLVPNHVIAHPHPNVLVTRQVEIMPVEVIVRGYVTGSAWRDYEAGRAVSGIKLPQGMRKSQRFDKPLITPSTKAERGQHDEPISSDEVVSRGLVEKKLWDEVCAAALKLFEFGTVHAFERGLILVDTKYEFGVIREGQKTELILADEVHTQDSSRYWIKDSYEARYKENAEPEMLDKEFVRGWLMAQGYKGDGVPPVFTDDVRIDTAAKYIQAFERITGQNFSASAGAVKPQVEGVLRELQGLRT